MEHKGHNFCVIVKGFYTEKMAFCTHSIGVGMAPYYGELVINIIAKGNMVGVH